MREAYGEPDVIQIRKIHTNRHDCIVWEHKVLRRLNAADNVRWLNVSNGSMYADSVRKVRVKDKLTGVVIGAVPYDHPLYLSGEYIHHQRGRKKTTPSPYRGKERLEFKNFISLVNPATLEYFKLHKDDPRIIIDDLVPWRAVFCHAIVLATGETISVKRDDPRLSTGELVGTSHRKVPAKDPKNPDVKFQVSVDDPRWATGELVHARAGCKHKNPQNASRPKEKNGRWSGISDDEYVEMILKLVEQSNNTLRWRQLAKQLNLPASRYHLRERVEQVYPLPTYRPKRGPRGKYII